MEEDGVFYFEAKIKINNNNETTDSTINLP